MNSNFKVVTCILVLFFLVAGGIKISFAATLAPQWTTMTQEQRTFLLEAFSIDENQKKLYWDPLPENIKQFIIDSMWKSVPPEKQQQILLYAHLDKPFSKASDTTSKIPPPKWASLSARQQGQLTEALSLDSTQLTVWNTLPNEIKQMYIDAVWPYIPSEKKNLILSSAGNTTNYNPTPVPTQTTDYNSNYSGTNQTAAGSAPKWASLTPQQQQALMMVFNFDSTQLFIWNTMTPELKQMFIDYVWQYLGENMKKQIMDGNTQAIQAAMAEQATSILPPPQWATLDAEEQVKLAALLKVDPTLWSLLPPEGKQFFLNTVWKFIPIEKQEEIMDAL